MSKKNIKDPSIMLKQTAYIISACAFVLGFFAGVGFTVYKTISAPSNTTSNGQEINYTQRAELLLFFSDSLLALCPFVPFESSWFLCQAWSR